MKKIALFVGIIACIFTACKDKNAYTLTGTFATSELNGKTVYLKQLDSLFQKSDTIDSAKVENGKFVFNGIAKELPVIQFVTINESSGPITFIAEKGKIEMKIDSTLNTATIKGTTLNDQYQQFIKDQANVFKRNDSIQAQFSDAQKSGDITPEKFQEFEKSNKQLVGDMENVIYNFVKPIITTPAGEYIFVDNLFYLNENQQKELISLATPDFQQLKGIQKIKKRIETKEATAVGKQFTDVKGFNLDGKEVSLSDYAGKGKVVLVDFWASWCGPCRQSMPDMVKIYQKYKNKGFEIVGISLDGKKDDWEKATKDLNITWPQFSNLKGWDEDCAVAYGVDAIPHTVLIDKDGKIIERKIYEETLDFKLQELLGSK